MPAQPVRPKAERDLLLTAATALRASGLTFPKIAAILGVPRTVALYYSRAAPRRSGTPRRWPPAAVCVVCGQPYEYGTFATHRLTHPKPSPVVRVCRRCDQPYRRGTYPAHVASHVPVRSRREAADISRQKARAAPKGRRRSSDPIAHMSSVEP